MKAAVRGWTSIFRWSIAQWKRLPGLRSPKRRIRILAWSAYITAAAVLVVIVAQPTTGPSNWNSYTNAAGLTLQYPDGWTPATDAANGQVTLTGTNSERVIVWPLYSRRPSLTPAAGARVLTSLSKQTAGEISTWGDPVAQGSQLVQMQGSSDSETATAILAWVSDPNKGTAGDFYLVSAAPSQYAGLHDTFAQILQSVAVQGQSADTQRAPHYDFARWSDPTERAFSLELPRDWKTRGGMIRPNPLKVASSVEATSPDGALSVLISDAFPDYIIPNAWLNAGGLGVGSTYSGTYQVQPYAAGARYLTNVYLPQRIGQIQDATETDLTDLASAHDTAIAGVPVHYAAGQVDYRFVRNGQAYQGMALCVTVRVNSAGFDTWHVLRTDLVEAPEGRLGEAEAVLKHAASSVRVDPQWAAQQARTTMAEARIIAAEGEAMHQILDQAYASRVAVQDKVSTSISKEIRGVVDVVDPQTNETYEVDNSPSYVWIDHSGNIVGTNTSARPDTDFHQLLPKSSS